MRKLQFDGDVTIDQIFEDHKREIYDNVIKAVQENYLEREIDEINVVKISIQSKDYSINLTRDKFIASLNRCISFFEQTEEYEKCQVCVNMIGDINNEKNKQLA
jgi:Ni,Fe-hydrogenase III component G